ncbi:unnamed protein product [Orchesella dallaii]|uniref:Uncharacterized protein n=1 Tax=Orchesella dallaii TaxID=48710 RepID=A0ABP1QVW8_9HEXA
MADTAKPEVAPSNVTADRRKTSVGSYGSGSEVTPMPRLTRSHSLTTSTLPTHVLLPPEMQNQYKRRRESLEKLQLEKVAPWMHLYDFSEAESSGTESAANSP